MLLFLPPHFRLVLQPPLILRPDGRRTPLSGIMCAGGGPRRRNAVRSGQIRPRGVCRSRSGRRERSGINFDRPAGKRHKPVAGAFVFRRKRVDQAAPGGGGTCVQRSRGGGGGGAVAVFCRSPPTSSPPLSPPP